MKNLLTLLSSDPISVCSTGYEPVVLHEDSTLAGFIPMLSAPQEVFYADSSVDKVNKLYT